MARRSSTADQSVLHDERRRHRTRINAEHDRSNMYRYNFRGALHAGCDLDAALSAEHFPPKNLEPVHKAHKFRVCQRLS